MKTPLYEEHTALNARMVDFANWEMPLLYTGIIPEHQHTRTQVSMFDISHMGEFEMRGPRAEADLERLLTQSIAAIQIGAGSYGYMLDERGGVIDDLICFRMGPDRFWLVVNAGTTADDFAWISEHISEGTQLLDLSADTAKLDIQGPRSHAVLTELFPGQVPELKYFRFQEVIWQDTPCLLSRTGYTGEWGYELFLPSTRVGHFWRMFADTGVIKPAGLGARDTLRLEAGYTLYGHELTRQRTPAGASQGRFMNFDKDFIGREAVRRELDDDQRRDLVGLMLSGRMAARQGDLVYDGDTEIGTVTSGLFAPSLNCAAALAYVNHSRTAPGKELEISTRNRKLSAVVTPLPLYTDGTARRKTPPT